MGQFLLPIAIAGVVGGGVLSAAASRRAGQEQSIELKQAALQEEDAAKDRELNRRRALVRALSTQIASFGASGVDPGTGSPAAIARRDAFLADEETAIDRAQTARQSTTLRRQARSARRIGTLRATSTLLSTGAQAASLSQ
jgi:hypothetical protein